MAGVTPERRILIGVKNDEVSEHCFDWFMEYLYEPSDFVIICHIPSTPDLPFMSWKEGLNLPAAEWSKKLESKIKENDKLYYMFEQKLIVRKVKYSFVGETFNNPAKGLAHFAEQEKADIIIIGNCFSKKFGFFHKSHRTSLYLATKSTIPVIICPGGDGVSTSQGTAL